MQRKCTCDQISPPLRILRSVEFNRQLSQFYCEEVKSGEAIINDVLNEIYDWHEGRLFGPDEAEILVGTKAGDRLFATVFGRDPKRFINRLRGKANRPLSNLLDRRCVMPVAILALARQIKLCRTQGLCSR